MDTIFPKVQAEGLAGHGGSRQAALVVSLETRPYVQQGGVGQEA